MIKIKTVSKSLKLPDNMKNYGKQWSRVILRQLKSTSIGTMSAKRIYMIPLAKL